MKRSPNAVKVSSLSVRFHGEQFKRTSLALDDRIEEMAQLVKDHYNISEFGDPSATTEVSLA